MKMVIGNFLLLLLLLNLRSATPIQPMKVSPCKVQNVVLQPQVGISVKTKKLVDILQAPAFFTQKVQADICVDTDTTFSRSLLPSIPQFMCRQRYTIVEVYIKPQEDFAEIGSEKLSGEQKANGFLKEFVFKEAGCDIFINFPTAGRFPESTRKKASSSLSSRATFTTLGESLQNIGITSINSNSYQQQFLPIFDAIEDEKAATELHSDSDHNLQPRSMIKSNFFRKGMHLYKDINTTDNHQQNHTVNSSDSSRSTSSSDTDNVSSAHKKTPANESDDKLAEGEIRLSPENIGLPLLILDPSIDPIMRLISIK